MWLICQLEFNGRKQELVHPNRYTQLFFLDEATALAAGHRPCWECRRPDAKAFSAALVRAGLAPEGHRVQLLNDAIAGEVQAVLKGDAGREQVVPASLPDGAFFAVGQTAFLKWKGVARQWSFDAYGPPQPLPAHAIRLTPRWTCAALATGYTPVVHPSV